MKNKYRITINRRTDENEISKENWKDLISSLVLAGYEVYGDEEKITFDLGYDDLCEEVDE